MSIEGYDCHCIHIMEATGVHPLRDMLHERGSERDRHGSRCALIFLSTSASKLPGARLTKKCELSRTMS